MSSNITTATITLTGSETISLSRNVPTATLSTTITVQPPLLDDRDMSDGPLLAGYEIAIIVVISVICYASLLFCIYRRRRERKMLRAWSKREPITIWVDLKGERLLGVTVEPEERSPLLGNDAVTGLEIVDVKPESVAEKSGLKIGHIILQIDGKMVNTQQELDFEVSHMDKQRFPILLTKPCGTAYIDIVAASLAISVLSMHADIDYYYAASPGSVSEMSPMGSFSIPLLKKDVYSTLAKLTTSDRTSELIESESSARLTIIVREIDSRGDIKENYVPMTVSQVEPTFNQLGSTVQTTVYMAPEAVCFIPFLKITEGFPPSVRNVAITKVDIRIELASGVIESAILLELINEVIMTDDGMIGLLIPSYPFDICMQFTAMDAKTFLSSFGIEFLRKTGMPLHIRKVFASFMSSHPIKDVLRVESHSSSS